MVLKIINLDLKGAPPTFEFLKQFIRYIGTRFKNEIYGILFEFEDTFPYE